MCYHANREKTLDENNTACRYHADSNNNVKDKILKVNIDSCS